LPVFNSKTHSIRIFLIADNIRPFLPRDALVSAKRGLAIACRLSVRL